jgi:hypothetical protein
VAVVSGGEDEEEQDDDKPAKSLTRQQQAEQLRLMVDTVGQPGKPGAAIQNVISVGMLSEGWDAKTVTHVMGPRAFSSQLHCEQVVGRGLRRTSYDLDRDTGLFEPEYVNIFGVPFTFLPHEGGDDTPPPPPKPKSRVEPMRERESEFGIAWPNIMKIEHVYSPCLKAKRHFLDEWVKAVNSHGDFGHSFARPSPVAARRADPRCLAAISQVEQPAIWLWARVQSAAAVSHDAYNASV